MSVRKVALIIGAAVLGVLAALIAVAVIIKSADKILPVDNEQSSGYTSTVSVPESVSSVVEETEKDNGIRLVISSPSTKNVTTTEASITFTGTSDIAEPLTVNGNPVIRGDEGIFSFDSALKVGNNVFTFEHKGEKQTYNIRYRYVVINYYEPSSEQEYSCGSTFTVSVKARSGSSVTASFNGKQISLVPKNAASEDEVDDSEVFDRFYGSFQLPSGNLTDLSLGKVTYRATYNGITESFSSGNIICKKPDFIVDYDPNATPLGGKYINVGSGIIAEIVCYEAETFDGGTADDSSRPTNNYLPKGTVDYCAQGSVYYEGSERKEYSVLRCGYRVYNTKKNKPRKGTVAVVKKSAGTLPDHNEITVASFENGTDHTVLTLEALWKAPFYFDILPQGYQNPKKQDYRVSNVTYNYIDITFCYATVFNGEIVIPEDNPLFKSAQIIKNQSDYTLRLYLKKQGGFYGWDAYYDEQDRLCFEFLNPATVTKADNGCGADLTGVSVLIDVGHGGMDIGAPGFNYKKHSEAIQNLVLARKIKAELEAAGATVHLTRNDDSTSSTDDKIPMLKRLKPDICIAVHHNSSTASSANGFDSYYFNAFSKKAAEYVYMHTKNTGIYKKSNLGWHYYFMARTSVCPVVLTENGYISNQYDYNNIINDAKNTAKAKAIAKGVAEYFLSLQ